MLVPWKDLVLPHLTTAQCAKGSVHKRRWLAAEEMRESAVKGFQACVRPFETVAPFKYLGLILKM